MTDVLLQAEATLHACVPLAVLPPRQDIQSAQLSNQHPKHLAQLRSCLGAGRTGRDVSAHQSHHTPLLRAAILQLIHEVCHKSMAIVGQEIVVAVLVHMAGSLHGRSQHQAVMRADAL